MSDAFWTLHSDLVREGPGTPDDVAWAARIAGLKPDARICDAGAGAGADISALLEAAPAGHVTAVDAHADFVERIIDAAPSDRVAARQSDMMEITGPYDFIWCAGAIYFVGVTEALTAWRDALAPGGHVAFSMPGFFTDAPSGGAVAFWQGFDGVLTEEALRKAIDAADYELKDLRRLGDAGWEAYYGPLAMRCDMLEDGADSEMREVIAEHRQEIANWRAHREETGYFACVVAPR